jgi:[ribosomal protein S5]-alanine N-acetyltransferase
MTVILETRRTRLREFAESDLDTLAAMVADVDQMRFYARPKTRNEAAEWIKRNISLYERIGFGFWFIESASASDFLGYCGIRPQEELGEIEMGWHTIKEAWNRGLATEAALACRDAAFDRFGLDRLIALISPNHGASIRVAEKIGLHPEKTTVLDGYPWIIYAIDAHEHITGQARRALVERSDN